MTGVQEEEVMEQLRRVMDPEIGRSITELNLIDEVNTKDGNVEVVFHLTMPYCPPMFAMKIAGDIRDYASKAKGVEKVTVKLTDHYMADYINENINR